ncbi:MAG TPA: DUF6776 family protein [Noviherbaspirillum sp.]|nr:DUF6776 family protein [Noviherbaspirillum sp.]
MTIRTQKPWTVRLLAMVIVLGLAGALAMWVYEMGRGLTGLNADGIRQQLVQYKEQIETLTAERDQLSSTANAAESRLTIEQSAQKQLASQVKVLESENIRLKEDLAFFESLLPNATGPAGVTIRRLKVDLQPPNQLRYRLLVMQGGNGEQQFVGTLQLVVTVLQDGKNAMMTFPDASPAEQGKFKLGFRHYQRVEGVLTLPEGSAAKQVQARVLEKGQVRTQASANL